MPSEKKAKKTSVKKRLKVLTDMTSSTGRESEEKEISFSNDDVPNFLRRLNAFEATSRNKILCVDG